MVGFPSWTYILINSHRRRKCHITRDVRTFLPHLLGICEFMTLPLCSTPCVCPNCPVTDSLEVQYIVEVPSRACRSQQSCSREKLLVGTWHAVNGLILQRNGGMSRTEIWRLNVFPLKCSSFGSSRSWPPWCRSSETTSCRRTRRGRGMLKHADSCTLSSVAGTCDTNTHFHSQTLGVESCWEIEIWPSRDNCSYVSCLCYVGCLDSFILCGVGMRV